ncbi:hypothetical protein ES332_D07G206000v1 [Gossypium tomentosum]|uniref:Poly A polymerase head domain-containing protein n=1 Tax=Gossypium tomentosum TaxID=34277 RepID=A0A5D2K9I1_GOSTO|nr:hypothetical protein ES332_D07G206000v1 [Gossypium tomentosum]
MAIFVRAKSFLSSSLRSLTRSQRCNHTLGERGLQAELYSGMAPAPNPALRPIDTSKWKKIQASKVGISLSMISFPSWIVLKILHKGGFEAYLVGGCVRDLLLNRTPKDFDVITTANLKQIRKKFHRAEIIGKRFPICRVHIKGSIIEVSSFETVARHDADKEKALSSLIPKICDEKDLIRWRNSRNRDFTINSLFFDPFTCNIYDYNGGMSDLKSLKLRTLIPAHASFQEDCARILRGLRIAARLCLSFSKDTERAMYDLSASIGGLDKFRLMLEVNYMLSYGAAVQSICLLQRFNLLNILLPFQAAYISQHRATKNSMMLMKLFFNLDKLVSCDHPADSSLWVGLLMFHLALVNNPQDALVIWTFASVLYHGNWKEGVEFAREYTKLEVKFVPEISEFSETKSDEDLAKEVAQFASLVQDSVGVLTETSNLFESMSRYPFSACSGLVFVPKITAKNTAKLFDLMVEDIRSFINGRGRMSPEINFHLLGIGDPCETRFVLGKIILETMKAGPRGDATEIGNDEKDLQPKATEEILSNNEIPGKKVKKNAPSSFIPDGNRGMLKKQKLVDDDTATKNQEMVTKDELNDLAEKHQEFGKTCKLSENKTNSMQGKISEKEEKSKKDKEKKSKKHTKVVEKSKHHIALHTVSKKQQRVVRELNLREEDEMDNLEKVLGKEEVKERTEEHKGRAGKERSGVSSLSSLFR